MTRRSYSTSPSPGPRTEDASREGRPLRLCHVTLSGPCFRRCGCPPRMNLVQAGRTSQSLRGVCVCEGVRDGLGGGETGRDLLHSAGARPGQQRWGEEH